MAANGNLAAIEIASKGAQPEERQVWFTGIAVALGITFWWLVYSPLQPAATSITSSLFRLDARTHVAAIVEFFIFEVSKVLMLLALVVFGVVKSAGRVPSSTEIVGFLSAEGARRSNA